MKKFFAVIFLFGLFTLSAEDLSKKFLGEWLSLNDDGASFVSVTFNNNGTCIVKRSVYVSVTFRYRIQDCLIFIDEQGYYFNFLNKKIATLVLTPAFGEASQVIQMVKL